MYEEFMGTKPVAERLKVDLDALSAYMSEHVDNFSGNPSIEQFKGGQSESNLQTYLGQSALCAAHQASTCGQVAAFRTCD